MRGIKLESRDIYIKNQDKAIIQLLEENKELERLLKKSQSKLYSVQRKILLVNKAIKRLSKNTRDEFNSNYSDIIMEYSFMSRGFVDKEYEQIEI